jgi:hypothetical protein
MKQIIISLFLLFFISSIFAQVPQGMNYQAVARDAQGQPISNFPGVRVRFSILQGSELGSPVYTELYNNVTTNFAGLFTLTIGQGLPLLGTFGNINWANGNKYLKVEIDPASGIFSLQGTSQLLSVPYALYAGNSGGGSQWKNSRVDNAIYYESNVGIRTDSALYNINNTSGNIYPAYGWKGMHVQSDDEAVLVIEGNKRARLHFASNSYFTSSTNLTPSVDFHYRNYVIETLNVSRDKSTFLVVATVNEDLSCAKGIATFHENGNVRIGNDCNNYQVPKSKLEIADGDVYLNTPNKGIIMKSPNGSCWRVTVGDNGQLVPALIPCPE